MDERSVETVTWINVVPLNLREKIARWWVEDVVQQQTYRSPRQRETEFQSYIAVDMIDQLASDGLRVALHRQQQEKQEDPAWVTFPRATPEGDAYFGSISIPRRPLGLRFTERGIEDTADENH